MDTRELPGSVSQKLKRRTALVGLVAVLGYKKAARAMRIKAE